MSSSSKVSANTFKRSPKPFAVALINELNFNDFIFKFLNLLNSISPSSATFKHLEASNSSKLHNSPKSPKFESSIEFIKPAIFKHLIFFPLSFNKEVNPLERH